MKWMAALALCTAVGCSPATDVTDSGRAPARIAATRVGTTTPQGEATHGRPRSRTRGSSALAGGRPIGGECVGLHPDAAGPAIVDLRLSDATTALCFRAFALLHSGLTRTPLYVAEHLTSDSVQRARLLDTRDNRFHPESRLPPERRAELADYRGSGLDRGHMAPSGDMGDPSDDFDSFSLANIVPQAGPLNRGGWAELEEYVRDLASGLGGAYVVTGPAFLGADVNRVGGRVLVPSHVWKAVYVPGQGAGAWIVTNDAEQRWEIVSIDVLAARIGIDPFPRLAPALRKATPAFPTFGTSDEKEIIHD